ncbi:MAG: protease-4 [Psychromonas sp.]|jgi:protease-4
MENKTQTEDRWIKAFIKENFAEQKKTRRWGVFFKSLTFLYLFGAVFLFFNAQTNLLSDQQKEPHTAMVQIKGAIAADKEANANTIVTGLRAAFKNEFSQAVMLVINSPGGSPVQAGYVFDEIQRLRLLYPDKKLYAVIAELGASGSYYIAAAADQIYADKASLVGSIGVTASSFGFVELMKKVGIERRHYTSGEHKGFLDPFSPSKESERDFWQEVLDVTHQQFIKVVKTGRGDRLNSNKVELFSGLIWNGEQALALGLIDGLGSPGFVAREVVKAENIVDYSVQPSAIEKLTKRLGISIGNGFANQLVSDNNGINLSF